MWVRQKEFLPNCESLFSTIILIREEQIIKKILFIVSALLCGAAMLAGCGIQKEDATTPNACSPAIMVGGTIYYSTGKEMPVEIDDSAILGKVTSTVNIDKIPTENGQTNIPFLNAPYAEYEDGLVLLMDEEWVFFETRD